MDIVYQFTFFFSLGLLAIIVTVYVFSVTQIGRATDLESKRQKDIISAQKETSEKQIKEIQEQLDQAKKVGRLDNIALGDKLNKGRREIASYTTQLNNLRKRTNLIKLFGAVVLPSSVIIITIILNTIASAISDNHHTFALALWIIGLFTLIFGAFRILKTLGAIEEVTINSQEAIDKLPEAVKSALIAIEQQKKPALIFFFKGNQPPFSTIAGQQINIDCVLSLISGDIARNIYLFFNAPPRFSFPTQPSLIPNVFPCLPPDDLPNYVAICIKPVDLLGGLSFPFRISINTPPISGNYTLFYQFICEGFNSGRISFPMVLNNSPASLEIAGLIPALGSRDVTVTPTFGWPKVEGATSYDFILAQDIGLSDKFSIIDYAATAAINSLISPQILKYNTSYFWRVRANIGSGISPWLTSWFTTGSAP